MTNKFKEKQAMAEMLEKLYRIVDEEEQGCYKSYEVVGEEQAKDWKTGELRWEDEEHTIPKMTNKYDYVMKTEEELDLDSLAKIKACQQIKTQLEKMI